MNASITADLEPQIKEGLSRAKWKKACYFYDDLGYKQFIGLYNKKTVFEIEKLLREQKLGNRLSVFDVKTTEPDEPLSSNRRFVLSVLEKNQDETIGIRSCISKGVAELSDLM
jgi:hypothetical protein